MSTVEIRYWSKYAKGLFGSYTEWSSERVCRQCYWRQFSSPPASHERKLIHLINRGCLDNHSLSQFFRRTHGRTLKIKASLSFFGLVTKQLSNISQRIKRSSSKWRTNPGQQLFDAWLPRRQKERYRSLNWECWGSSKTNRGLAGLPCLQKQACAKGLFWGLGLCDTKLQLQMVPGAFPRHLQFPGAMRCVGCWLQTASVS